MRAGEAEIKSHYDTIIIAGKGRRYSDGGMGMGALLRCAAIWLALAFAFAAVLAAATARGQQKVTFANARTVTVTVTVGKSQDIHTDQSLVDIMVGDPDIADVNPLTDHALSILGKKIGTTRVTVYGQDKKVVGIFDIEVSYDVSRLSAEIARFTGGGIKVSSINGRIMLSGTSPDAVTLDKAVTIARQFGPEPINTVQVMQPQRIMREGAFVEANRQASRELGVQWNMFGNSALANVGSGLPASQLPITTPGGAFQQPAVAGSGLGGPNVLPTTLPLSPIVAAGVLSGAAPFGFLVGQLSNRLQIAVNALEERGRAGRLAEPNLVALSGDTASFLAGGEFPFPVQGQLNQITIEFKKFGVGLAFTPTVLAHGLINLKIQPEFSQLDPTNTVSINGVTIPSLIVRRASTTLELRDGQSFAMAGL